MTLAVRGGVNIIPRDVLGVPILGIGISMSFLPPEVADVMAWPLIQATIGDVRKLGYRPAVSDFLAEAAQVCAKDGVPKKSGDAVLPGLYVCGFHVSPTGMLREIAIEARRIARSVASV